MPAIHRRTFLERLSLGAGAAILSAMITGLVSEARGAVGVRKRFIVISYPNGGYWQRVCPPAHKLTLKEWEYEPFLDAPIGTLPDTLAPLAPLQNKLLLVDGLVNRNSGGHFGRTLLTGVPKLTDGEHAPLGGKSLDQHVAGVLGKTTLFPSVHLGSTTGGDGYPGKGARLLNHMYAKGPGQPVPVQLIPAESFATVFPTGTAPQGATTAPSGPPVDLLQRRRLLDWIADDVKRARAALAGTEQAKLDEYLGAIENAQKRVIMLEQQWGKGGASCATTGLKQPDPKEVEPDDVFEAQLEIGLAAIQCGLTNVLSVSFVGIGAAFTKRLGLTTSLHGIGHGEGTPDVYIKWFASQAYKFASRLAGVREGNGTLLDSSVILFANDNNEQHHSRGSRYPVVLIGGGGGALRADGRYVRYPALRSQIVAPKGPEGMRPVSDLLATLSHVLDAPVDMWPTGGREQARGPLRELMT